MLSNPTNCDGPQPVKIEVRSWQNPDRWVTDTGELPAGTGCNQLDFSPRSKRGRRPTSPTRPPGLDVDLHIPQNEDPDGLAEAHLRDAAVTLPEGMTVNPASADGLGACSPAQVGLTTAVGEPPAHFSDAPVSCPDASKLGTVRIDTPLLDHPLKGAVYLATQNQNPFGSLLALYIVVEDPKTGVIDQARRQGRARSEDRAADGRASTTTRSCPFEDLRVELLHRPAGAR